MIEPTALDLRYSAHPRRLNHQAGIQPAPLMHERIAERMLHAYWETKPHTVILPNVRQYSEVH